MAGYIDHRFGAKAQCIATVGLVTVDHVFEVDSLPSKPEKHFATASRDIVGGIAGNAAIAVASLGAVAKIISRTGGDNGGQLIASQLRGVGVSLQGLRVIDSDTSPTSVVLVDRQGERMIVNHKSDSLFADPCQIDFTGLKDVTTVLADLRWLSGTFAVFAWAEDRGIPRVLDFDLNPDFISNAILEKASHIIFSESALKQHCQTGDPKEALYRIRQQCPGAQLAFTAGAQGVWFINEAGAMAHIPSRTVDVVNTLGAGDVFHGAAALAIAEGLTFENALLFANDVAAVRVSNKQTNYFPSKEDVMIFERTTR